MKLKPSLAGPIEGREWCGDDTMAVHLCSLPWETNRSFRAVLLVMMAFRWLAIRFYDFINQQLISNTAWGLVSSVNVKYCSHPE